MSNSRHITAPQTFAEQVGQTIMDALTTASADQLGDESMLGLLFLNSLGRAGLRLVRVTDETIGPEDITVELPTVDLPLQVRIRQAMDLGTTMELVPTVELPALLRKQAE